MFAKACYRTLDRPLTILGVEPGDLVLVVLAALVVFLFVGQIAGILLGAALGALFRRVRRGKPPGYLFEVAYRHGLLRFLPSAFLVPHLVRPPLPWGEPVIRLSAFEGDIDHERPEIRFHRAGRARL